MGSFLELVKKGNTSSLTAALGNTVVAIVKGVAASISGSGTMFASAMHSLADTINQAFVFVGSVLAEKKPTKRFPLGFGRVINLFCMVAVIVVSIMAYETILEGIHLLSYPSHTTNFWLNIGILAVSIIIDGSILWKAMNEIVHESRIEAKGLGVVGAAFKNVGRAAPPTRLVFYEDIVATSGALIALIAVTCAQLTPFKMLDGIGTILIGVLMIGVVYKVGYDNLVGLIGVAAPTVVEEKVSGIILSDPDVTDIHHLRILQEGRTYHVDGCVELTPGMALSAADDVKLRLKTNLLSDPDITDVVLAIVEDNGVRDWPENPIK